MLQRFQFIPAGLLFIAFLTTFLLPSCGDSQNRSNLLGSLFEKISGYSFPSKDTPVAVPAPGSCLMNGISRGLRQACDETTPCREDYICQSYFGIDAGAKKITRPSDQRGYCVPTYFIFQMRLDGHPVALEFIQLGHQAEIIRKKTQGGEMFKSSALSVAVSTIVLNTSQGASAMSYQVQTHDVTAQKVLVIKSRVKVEDAGEAIGEILGRIGSYLKTQGQDPIGAPFTRTFSHKDGMLEFEAGFPVTPSVKGNNDIMRTELPEGKVAVTTHVGSQDTSPDAYKALHIWMTKNGKKEAGAPWEVYISPEGTPEKDAKMQIFYPIR